jgi:hypothetical protein
MCRSEEAARAEGRGIWQAPTEAPWDWRRQRSNLPLRPQRLDRSVASAQAAPNNCAIKGNINSVGVRIYHTPASPWYAQTTVNESRGQRWFCSEAEARAAGWRAARW